VLCLGEMFDCLADQVKDRSSKSNLGNHSGGAPANVACALRSWAPQLDLLAVGSGGGRIGKVVARSRSGFNWVQRHPTAPTRQVNVLRSESGDRIFAGFRDHDTQNLPIHACKRLSCRFRYLQQISGFGYTRVGLSASRASVFHLHWQSSTMSFYWM